MLSYVDRKRLERAMYYAKDPVLELDAPVPGAEDVTLGESLPAAAQGTDVVVETMHRAQLVRRALESMTLRERAVMRLRHGLYDGDPLTLEAVGALAGLSRERIRQLEDDAVRHARIALGVLVQPAGTRRCTNCRKDKPEAEFEKNGRTLRHCLRCRAATAAANRRWSGTEKAPQERRNRRGLTGTPRRADALCESEPAGVGAPTGP